MTAKKVTLLCVMDGFGLNPDPRGNAVDMARKPHLDKLLNAYPHSTLVTYGERVGLPNGQMGNSEVGHLNIGAGRVVEQWLLRISRALEGNFLQTSQAYASFITNTKDAPSLQLFGLFSDGGVHSHVDHLKLLIKRVHEGFAGNINLHLITDGRDVSPTQSGELILNFEKFLADYPRCKIATICGRFHAMDRDKRWERTGKAFNAYVHAEGEKNYTSPREWILASYEKGITDEFIEPAIFNGYQGIHSQDGALFWNFREDRMRQLVGVLCVGKSFAEALGTSRSPAFLPERTLCFTEYDHNYHLPFLFSQIDIGNHLGEVVSKAGLTQLRVAETEKYPHVTYFFNGGIEKEYAGEERHLIPSPREVKTYDQKPEMSAYPVTEVVLEAIRSRKYDFIVVNLANCDMVGHTGNVDAAITAVETVDECVGKMIAEIEKHGDQAIFIADHGNAEQLIHYTDGSPHTAHTTYPVPIAIVGRSEKLHDGGALCDVAPTVLAMMDVAKPLEMSGASLLYA